MLPLAQAQVSSPEDVVGAIALEPTLAAYTIRRQAEDWVELEVGSAARPRGVPAVLVLAWPDLWQAEQRLSPHLARARSGNYGLIFCTPPSDGERGPSLAQPAGLDHVSLPMPATVAHLAFVLGQRAEACAMRQAAAALELDLERARHETDMLISVGRKLADQSDIGQLLETILKQAREVTGADAGSVYIVEDQERELTERTIRFAILQNDSRSIEPSGFSLRVTSKSIVGACVTAGETINIPDLYALDTPGTGNNPWGFVHDRHFDERYRYQTRAVLSVPMISARNQVIGVIQLINKRAKGWSLLDVASDFDLGVVPFDETSVAHAAALAAQAGISLENTMLNDEVRTLFEGFVRASVTAIESRDPTTSGHSERVAALTVGLAKAVDRVDHGPYVDARFPRDTLTQIEYAALLHDFGKVGVREHVLVKAKKLYEHQRELIEARFRYARRGLRLEALERALDASARGVPFDRAVFEASVQGSIGELDEVLAFIRQSNEPTVLEQGGFERIADIACRTYHDDDGHAHPLLGGDEVAALQIMRGSLTEQEREEINRHVVHTFNFLSRIPWGRQFGQVPAIAGAHHEKLDGSGYPHGLVGAAIPVPARMMTIADIYDALTAKDRPYKRAIPLERALDILASDVKKGQLDAELFRIFVDAKVFETA